LQIPFLSRLHLSEYFSLAISLLFVALEHFISIITLLLPTPIISLCYRATRRLFNYLSSPSSRRNRNYKKGVWSSIANASDFVELCELYGYYAEEHILQTKDGYLLGLHRLGWRRGEEGLTVNGTGDGVAKKKVVYLHHGLLMNSEVWVCLTERERCLPFELVERGYDVWLGNNRGNKYSKKSVHCAPTSTKFWNFSMDQFAFHDIPDSIAYILETTNQPSLSYIGFSQGTAQAFATLSIHPTLNEKVDVFIALAPAMSPKGLTSRIVDSFVKASPDVLFLAFGRRAILGSTPMWQAILYPPIFVRIIDTALRFLFGWTGKNMTPDQKLAAYPHLYSYTSTKSVVHWFQIIRNGVFQMYDDEAPSPVAMNRNKYYKVAKFPTRNIKTPIVLVYGGSDSLVDINVMLKELPRHTVAKEISHYEHLDFLWADSVDELVFPHVFEALDKHARPEASTPGTGNRRKRQRASTIQQSHPSGALPAPGDRPEAEDTSSTFSTHRARKITQNTSRPSSSSQDTNGRPHTPILSPPPYISTPESPGSRPTSSSRIPHPASYAQAVSQRQHSPVHARTPFSPPKQEGRKDSHVGSSSQVTAQSSTSRPEGWWSSDEVAGSE
ncbi:alpha/beta-hydrolase, partial [Delitschia confertaspora ATCC 74209]